MLKDIRVIREIRGLLQSAKLLPNLQFANLQFAMIPPGGRVRSEMDGPATDRPCHKVSGRGLQSRWQLLGTRTDTLFIVKGTAR